MIGELIFGKITGLVRNLKLTVSRLYGLVCKQFFSVADVFSSGWNCVKFRRCFRGDFGNAA